MARNKFDIDESLDTKFDINQIKRLFGYIKPYKMKLIQVVLVMLISTIAATFGPYLLAQVIDIALPDKNFNLVLVLAAAIFALQMLSVFCIKFKIKTMNRVGQSIIHKIREDIMGHLQKLPFSYYDDRPHGKILVRVVNYVNSLSDLLTNGIVNIIADIFTLLVILAFMLALDPKLTLISLLGIPLLMICIFAIKTRMRRRWQAVSAKQSNINAYIHESILGSKVTQSFVREETNKEIFEKLSSEYQDTWLGAVRMSSLLWPFVDNVSTFVRDGIYVVSYFLITGGNMQIGVLIAFVMYINRFWMPVANISNFYNQITVAVAYLERIFETLDEQPLIEDKEGAKELPSITGSVEFKDVVFSYDENKVILDGVNFKVEPGETIALVGPTGAGKSTIINLISRFYDITSGAVLVDGEDVRDVTLASLRKQMGIMLQDTFVFSGNIIDNIRYGKLDATDDEIIEAAKVVQADEFIQKMKDGYYTEVKERGSRLSVGERQLISFARALLADPKILILDEATSSIDTETEKALQYALDKLLEGRTSFVIAHRLSTIKNSSKIMYIDEKNILECGTHNELIDLKGHYYKLYMSQYNAI